jgi:predicted dinucleotide-binding enzyme
MIIAVIGAGNIGGTLGKKWAQAGHTLRFGVRSPGEAKFDELRSLGAVSLVGDALDGADAVLLSLPGGAVAEFAAQYGASLANKIVIDAANNVRSPEMHNLAVLKEKAPEARLVRAFNSLGWENFANPVLGGVQIDLFYCSEPAARPAAEQLIGEIGLRPVCTGGLETAATVDAMTRLWFALAMGQGYGRRIAFKLLEES